jgi:hypothetical protein
MAVSVLFFSLAACSKEDSDWAGTVFDSAGVTIVSNPETGIWGPGEEWVLEEDLRIGAVEGDLNYVFGRIAGIGVDSDGRILVLDGQAQHIQVYSSDGVYEQTLGRRGDGPGELRFGGAPLIGPGDTILVPDAMGRFVRFLPDGSSAGASRMELQKGVPVAIRTTPSGLLAAQIRLRDAGVATGKDAMVLLGTEGVVTDTLITLPSDELRTYGRYQIYFPKRIWDISVDTLLLLGESDDYRIRVYSGAYLDRIIEKPFEARMVTDRDKEAVNNFLRATFSSPGRAPEDVEALVSRYDYSGPFPAFDAVSAGPRNTIWVQQNQAPSELNGEEFETFNPREDFGLPLWDVFDSEGRFLGVVSTPDGFVPGVFRQDKLYGVWRDQYGVEYVLRLRIVHNPGQEIEQ